jgi:hypothetical protein
MAVFLRKLLGIGKLPDEMRAEVEAEGIVHLAEYVSVTRRFSGRVPGTRSAGRTIDQRWDAPQQGAVKAELSATGLVLHINVAEVDQRCSGRLSLHYKDALPEEVLMRIPRRSLAFDVPPEYVFRAVGVPYHP